MKRNILLASGTMIVLLSTALLVRAAEEPSVDTVLAKHIAAMGGKAALEKVNSCLMKVKLEGEAFGTAEGEVVSKAPNKIGSRIELASGGTIAEGCDGTVAWAKNPWEGLRVKTGEELAKAKRDAAFRLELKFKTLYPDLAVKGTEKVGEEEACVLEAKPSASSKEKFWFSTKTGLILRQDSEFEGPQGTIKLNVLPQDYKTVEGVKYPGQLKLKVTTGDQVFEMTMRFLEIQPNAKVDDSRFTKPSE